MNFYNERDPAFVRSTSGSPSSSPSSFPVQSVLLARRTTPPPGKPRCEELSGVFWCVLRALEGDHSFPLLASPREQVVDLAFAQQRKKPPAIAAIEPRASEDDKVYTETHPVVHVDPLDTSEFSQSQQTQAPKRLSADPVPVAADPHLGFRFLDRSQVATAPDLEDPTSGVLEQLSFVESQEELPVAHLPPADSVQGISRETSPWSLSGPPFCSAFAASPSSGPHICDHG